MYIFIFSKEDEIARNRDRFLVYLKLILYSLVLMCFVAGALQSSWMSISRFREPIANIQRTVNFVDISLNSQLICMFLYIW